MYYLYPPRVTRAYGPSCQCPDPGRKSEIGAWPPPLFVLLWLLRRGLAVLKCTNSTAKTDLIRVFGLRDYCRSCLRTVRSAKQLSLMIICAMSWMICLAVLAAHAVAGAPCEGGSDPVREIYKIGGYKTPAIPKAISDLTQKWCNNAHSDFCSSDGEACGPRNPRVGVQGLRAMTLKLRAFHASCWIG